jgi:signal transduction histidine kinase
MSIRLRLTLIYTAILALTLMAFGTALYVIQDRTTMLFFERAAANAAERIVEGRQLRSASHRLAPPGFPLPPSAPRDIYLQIRGLDGAVIERPANASEQTLPLTDAARRAAQAGHSWTETASQGGERLLIYNAPVAIDGQTVEIVQVALPLLTRDHGLGMLRRTLLIGSSLVSLAAFGIGWGLAGLALRPIHRITQTAQVIGTQQDFSKRVEYAGPNDEVSQLATTFNTMLTQLESAYQEMERALEMQRQFVADVSHELRTPLTTIRGNLELLRRQPPISAVDRGEVLADMGAESERLIRLVSNLLMLARAEARRPLHSEEIALGPLVEDICRQVMLLAPQRSIVNEATLDACVLGNPDALKQVLLILLDNAIKHTPPAAAITVRATDTEKGSALLVCDNGPGIDPQRLPRIFDRFYHADPARAAAGSGLGLAIAKSLVTAQNGTLTVESEAGHGSTFTVTLPRAEQSGE